MPEDENEKDDRAWIEEVLLPWGFKIVPGISEKNGWGLVYGRFMPKRTVLRVMTHIHLVREQNGFFNSNMNPVLLKFVMRGPDQEIVKVSSEREVPIEDDPPERWIEALKNALHDWKVQFAETDIRCSKCRNGYVNVDGLQWVKCEYCEGKSYLNFNDRRRNNFPAGKAT